jgi:hypothetical protein
MVASTPGKTARMFVAPAESGTVRQVTNGEAGAAGDFEARRRVTRGHSSGTRLHVCIDTAVRDRQLCVPRRRAARAARKIGSGIELRPGAGRATKEGRPCLRTQGSPAIRLAASGRLPAASARSGPAEPKSCLSSATVLRKEHFALSCAHAIRPFHGLVQRDLDRVAGLARGVHRDTVELVREHIVHIQGSSQRMLEILR